MTDGRREAAVSLGGHAAIDAPGQLGLAIGSIGVVYGDIGTSPLYAFRVALKAAVGEGPITGDAVLGGLSLILWALTITVTLQYGLILFRAGNHGARATP